MSSRDRGHRGECRPNAREINNNAIAKLRTGKEQSTKLFCGRRWPVWDPVFDPQNPPEKVYVGSFLRSFPANEAHKLFYLICGPKLADCGWGPKSLC